MSVQHLFSLFFPPAFSFYHSSYFKTFQFLYSPHMAEKRLFGVYLFYLSVILWCQLLVTLFRLNSFQFLRFVAFAIDTTFLLHPVSFVAVSKLPRPCIYTSRWVQYSTPGFFFFGWRFMYMLVALFFLWKFIFACAILDAISLLLLS